MRPLSEKLTCPDSPAPPTCVAEVSTSLSLWAVWDFPIHLGSLSLWGISLRDPWAQAGWGGVGAVPNFHQVGALLHTLGASGWREGKQGRLYSKARANHFLAQRVGFRFRKMGLITAL